MVLNNALSGAFLISNTAGIQAALNDIRNPASGASIAMIHDHENRKVTVVVSHGASA